MSAWAPALRIARRSVLRSPARSLLVICLVALPAAGATFADVIARTLAAPERQVREQLGDADAGLSVTPYERLRAKSPLGGGFDVVGDPIRDPADVDVARLVPRGTHVVPVPGMYDIRLERVRRSVGVQLVVADVREPLHRFQVKLESGRAPSGPGEVLVTPALAERLKILDDRGEVRADAIVALRAGPRARVSGLSRAPSCLSCEYVVATRGSTFGKRTVGPSYSAGVYGGSAEGGYLVDLPPGTSAEALRPRLLKSGVVLTTRDEIAHPAGSNDQITAEDLRAIALVTLIVGLGLLEIVLLAGTAFAVGARRQVRELGLVTANGGSPRDVRRMLLAQGLVLGALGTAAGIAMGFAITLAGRPLWERLADNEIRTWTFGGWEIAGIALIGLLSGLAAAFVPAITAARMRPVDALAGRFGDVRARGGYKLWLGGLLVLGGAACGVTGDRLLADDFAVYERALRRVARTGEYVNAPAGDIPLLLIVGGATLIVAGLVFLTPSLIGWLGSAGARLPLSLRLAARDAGRHRHRTGPATTAIAMAVAGSVVLANVLANQLRAEEARHVPQLPANVLAIQRDGASTQELVRGAERAASLLPHARAITVRVLRDEGPPEGDEIGYVNDAVAVADSEQLLAMVGGSGFDAAARRALREGKALVVDHAYEEGHELLSGTAAEHVPMHVMKTDVAHVNLPNAFLPPSLVRAHHIRTVPDRVLVAYGAGATADKVDAAIDAAGLEGVNAYVDDPPGDDDADAVLLIIAGMAAFVTIFGVAISVALSAAEGRADLATLAAVGAPPGRRRAIVASQALFIGGLGCALGVAFGSFVAFTARAATGSPEFVVPWTNVLATGIGVPMLAAAVAALAARGPLPLMRRAE